MKKTLKDSSEELFVIEWLNLLKKEGFVDTYVKQPEFIIFNEVNVDIQTHLKGKLKIKKTPLLKQRVYTADLEVKFNDKSLGSLVIKRDSIHLKEDLDKIIVDDNLVAYFEVKASNWVDTTNTERFFLSRTQPLMYEKFGIYVNLIKPLLLFERSFIPDSLLSSMYYKKDVYIGKGDKKKLKAKIGQKKYKFEYITWKDWKDLRITNNL